MTALAWDSVANFSAAPLRLATWLGAVSWLFADTRAGDVSQALAGLAQVRLVSGSVTVYELR
ncbi:hypothetical protein [Micromonospora sp. NPDC093244]|uniref:hypothetical protein n=1 Tax=Micromonospora sp. NPDC093244 TaxID=3155071 RepID=UPI00342B9CCF